jgi:hypothetical protein
MIEVNHPVFIILALACSWLVGLYVLDFLVAANAGKATRTVTTMLTVHILMLLSRYGLRNFLLNLGTIIGTMLLKLLLFVALSIARLFNCFFFAALFTVFIAPTWLLNRYSTSIAHRRTENNDNVVQRSNGIPEGWVTVKICRTDEISELDLGGNIQMVEDPDRTLVGSGEIGEWEDREMFVVTKEEIERRVWTWLEGEQLG